VYSHLVGYFAASEREISSLDQHLSLSLSS